MAKAGRHRNQLWHEINNLWPSLPGLSRRRRRLYLKEQGWITSAHVRDLMARAAANSLGTITNLEKMAAFLKVSYGAQFMVKKESQTENGRKKFLH